MHISYQSLQLLSIMDGHIGCQCKGRQTDERGNYSPSCNMIFIIGNAVWYSCGGVQNSAGNVHKNLVNLKKLKFFLL